MFSKLIHVCDQAVQTLRHPVDVEGIGHFIDTLHPVVTQLEVHGEGLPFGRYLIHADPGGLYNIQLDLFSPDYTGMIHNHDTWGCFWVLKGALRVWDYHREDDHFVLIRRGISQGGSVGSFVSPCDWHKVGTPAFGPQTASLHIYGPGFDLDQGTYVDEKGLFQQGKRSPFKDLEAILPALRLRGV